MVTYADIGLSWADKEHMDGYSDGRDLDCPEPSENRSDQYKHSFKVGRAERANRPIPAHISRRRASEIEDPYDF